MIRVQPIPLGSASASLAKGSLLMVAALLLTLPSAQAEQASPEAAFGQCLITTQASLKKPGQTSADEENHKRIAEASCAVIRQKCNANRQGKECQDLLGQYTVKEEVKAELPEGSVVVPEAPKHSFDFQNRKNPFKSFLVERMEELDKLAKNQEALLAQMRANRKERTKELLEAYEIDSLTFVGVIRKKGVFYAMIQDKEKRGYLVKTGNYLGTNEGRISEISESVITIEEQEADFKNARIKTRSVQMKLKKEEHES